jgi:hypothetical protein
MKRKIVYAIISLSLIICDYFVLKYLWNEWINRPTNMDQYCMWIYSCKFYIILSAIICWYISVNFIVFLTLSIFFKKLKSIFDCGLKIWLSGSYCGGLIAGLVVGLIISLVKGYQNVDMDICMFLSIIVFLTLGTIIGVVAGLIMEYKIPENQIK